MGTVNVFSWIAICAGICIIIPQLVLGMVVFYNETFVIKRWHTFLIFQALNFIVLLYNLFVLRRAEWTHNIGCKLQVIWLFGMPLTNFLSCSFTAMLLHLPDYQLSHCVPKTAQRVCLDELRECIRMARRNCLLDRACQS